MSKSVVIEDHDLEFDIKEAPPAEALPLWYEQFLKLPDSKRKQIIDKVLNFIKERNKAGYDFIKNTKSELVGVSPRIVYTLASEKEGDLDISWIHAFSMATLLFWCEQGKFGFFINPVLRYNDTVLNNIEGNKKNKVKGFTG